MSDYLANLAARTLAAPSLRPRLRMRFEPELAEPEHAPTLESAPRATPRTIEATAQPEPRRAKPEPMRSEARHEAMPQAEPFREAARAAEPAPQAQPSAQRIYEEHATTTHERETTHVVERERVERSETREVVREIPHRHDIERVVQASGLPLGGRRQGRPEAHTTPPTQPQSRVITQPAPAPLEPTIHVSIGRIEVRAAAPAPRSAQPNKRPVMTIDDYVARRKERR